MITDNDFKQLAYYLYRIIEGDDYISSAYALMQKYGFIDEDYEWIYDDE